MKKWLYMLMLLCTAGCRTIPPCTEAPKHTWGEWSYDAMGPNSGGWVKREMVCAECGYVYKTSVHIDELRVRAADEEDEEDANE